MRPDRIILGEVRGAEVLDMLQAMNTGHDGSLGTLHANTPYDAIGRLETMVLMAGFDLPVRAIRQQVAGALDLKVIAEGIEDPETLELLRVIGCDIAQGFYLSRPIPIDALFELLNGKRSRRAA